MASHSNACPSSGLCLNALALIRNHVLWAIGYTDKTMQDKACPQICGGDYREELPPWIDELE